MTKITPLVYDENIAKEGEAYQVAQFYEPSDPPRQRRFAILEDVLDLKSGDTVLDVGCGVGGFAYRVVQRGAFVVGLDYSFVSLKMATKLIAERQPKGVFAFVAAEAGRLPFANNVFDKIIAADFIEHITDEDKTVFLKEAERVLKKGGFLVVFTPNKTREDLGYALNFFKGFFSRQPARVNELHFGLTTRAKFEKLLRSCGWRYSFRYEDLTRPWLARVFLARRFLSLNLLWIARHL